MPCYHPLAFIPVNPGDPETKYKCIGKYTPELKRPPDLKDMLSGRYTIYEPGVIKVPCGKCLGCRLEYSRQWADRMILELETNEKKGIFLTLTYNDDHVPPVYDCDENGEVILDRDGEAVSMAYTLRKRDLQLAFKRLRDQLPPDKKIRYYACGEYGGSPQTGKYRRPHYHAIVFGVSLDDFPDRTIVNVNELGQPYYTSPTLVHDMWTCPEDKLPYGFLTLSEVSYKTCAYVSRYTMKKVFSVSHPDFCEPEFVVMSRRPGIGAKYLESHPDCLEKKHIYIRTKNGSVSVGIPKYFLQKLKLTDKDAFDKIVEERRILADDNELLALKRTSLPYLEQNVMDENFVFNKTKILFNLREEDFHDAYAYE